MPGPAADASIGNHGVQQALRRHNSPWFNNDNSKRLLSAAAFCPQRRDKS